MARSLTRAVARPLTRADSSLPIGIYVAASGVVTLIAMALLPEPNRAAEIAREFEQGATKPVPEPVVAQAPRRVAVPSR